MIHVVRISKVPRALGLDLQCTISVLLPKRRELISIVLHTISKISELIRLGLLIRHKAFPRGDAAYRSYSALGFK